VKEVQRTGKLPVVNFAAGGVATPADAALMMQLGMDGVFVGSGIFKSHDAAKRAKAIVQAVTHFTDAKVRVNFKVLLLELAVSVFHALSVLLIQRIVLEAL
jgi:pyridoxal 5'-phosphate synthase pdxS subunit